LGDILCILDIEHLLNPLWRFDALQHEIVHRIVRIYFLATKKPLWRDGMAGQARIDIGADLVQLGKIRNFAAYRCA
jgi:hypothetical protein